MKLYRTLALASVSIAAWATPAFAQSAPANAGAQGGVPGASSDTGFSNDTTIVVQARRRDERAQDVPLVVNAISGAELDKDNIHNFQEIVTEVPGLSLVANPDGIGSSSSLRGVNDDVNVSGQNGTIQYYINDAPVNSDVVFQTMFDIGNLDVERGPQGTLRGRAAPSGAIAITTRQPDLEEPGVTVDGTAGSHDTKNLQFGIGVPIIKDVLAVRVAGVYDFNRGSRVTSVNDPSVKPNNETKALRASIRFEPTDWLKSSLNYTTLDHEGIGFDQAISFGLVDPTQTPSPTSPSYGTITAADRKSVEFAPFDVVQKFQQFIWHVEADFAGQRLIYVGQRNVFNYDSQIPGDSGGYFPSLSIRNDTRTHSIEGTHEVRLQNAERVLSVFDYVAGFFSATDDVATLDNTAGVLGLYYGPSPVGFTTTSTGIAVGPDHTHERSFFGNLTAHLGGKTEISGGLRHIQYHDQGQNLAIPAYGLTLAAPVPIIGNTTIYNITVRHRFSDDLMVYASTASAWRPGTFSIGDFSIIQSSNEGLFTNTAPEKSKNYEIGVKSQWLDKKVLLNVTYYHQNFKNYPFRTGGGGVDYIDYTYAGGTVTPNIGTFNFTSGVPVTVNGVETEIGWSPVRDFSLDANIDYSKSRMGANAVIPCDNSPYNVTPTLTQLQAALPAGQNVGACSGAGLPASFLPNWSGTVKAEYSHPVNSELSAFVRGIVSWRGASANDPLNPFDNVGAYALINAYLGLRDPKGGWTLTLYGKNVGNVAKETTLNGRPTSIGVTNYNVAGGATPPNPNYITNYGGITVTQPREFGVNLRIALGSR